MTELSVDEQHHERTPLPTSDEFVARLFSVVMTGVLAVIVLMAIAAGW